MWNRGAESYKRMMALRRVLARAFVSNTGVVAIPKDVYGNEVDITKPGQSSKLTHLSDAEELINRVPVILVDDDVVRCTGVAGTGLGHPVSYIQLHLRNPHEPNTCKWCGLRYMRNPRLSH